MASRPLKLKVLFVITESLQLLLNRLLLSFSALFWLSIFLLFGLILVFVLLFLEFLLQLLSLGL